jgi:hypothetical protein
MVYGKWKIKTIKFFLLKMKFPINREKLQNIKKDVEEEIIQCNVEEIIENTKVRILVHAYYQGTYPHLGGISNTKLKIDISQRFQIIIPDNLKRYIQINSLAHPLASFNPWKTHFEIIKETLMELFPGVSFETDPLKTYMLVDWS